MTTQLMRGREPEQHEMHTPAVAATVVGRHGQITIEHSQNVPQALRVHNAGTPGGMRVALEDPSTVPGMLPNAKVVPPMLAETTGPDESVTVHHQLGYEPMVVAITAGGRYADCTIAHDDPENVTVTFDNVGTYTIYIR